MNGRTIKILIHSGFTIAVLLIVVLSATNPGTNSIFILDLEKQWGAEMPEHYRADYTEEQVKQGYELVHNGKTQKTGGGKTRYISKYYACTSCHNTVREHGDLSTELPQDRLEYAIEHQVPFLPASTFYGIVNKTSWYNDDYILKYGDLVEKAQGSLAESIQLCAQVCSQGRTLEDWEIESITAYFHTLGYTLNDLELTDVESKELKESHNGDKLALIKQHYLDRNSATFGSLPLDKEKGYPYEGDASLGKAIYQLGCQHCHRDKGVSDVILDDSKATLRWLKRNIASNGDLSIYEIIRKGTYSAKGHEEYMPHYTLEKMSDEQLEDLRAYIELGAK